MPRIRLPVLIARFAPPLAWLGETDKLKHLAATLLLVPLLGLFLPLWAAWLATQAIGLGKELLDLFYYRSGFCWWDMLANVIGSIAGLALALSLTLT